MARHDVSRTGATGGRSNLERPTIAWRRYMGGAVGSQQLLARDVNGDGAVEVVFISGGKLVAKRSDDSIVWETPPFDLFRIDTVRDLDNDGTLDVVATGRPGRVMIFSGRDGRVEWQTGAPPFGPTIGAVRFARLDGDMLDDMYVTDVACGSTDNTGDTAFAYSFARGFGTGLDTGEQRLWQLERGRDYNCGNNDVVADLNGDGRVEVVAFGTQYSTCSTAAPAPALLLAALTPMGAIPSGSPCPMARPSPTSSTWTVTGTWTSSATPTTSTRRRSTPARSSWSATTPRAPSGRGCTCAGSAT
jgi:hypothetical protein